MTHVIMCHDQPHSALHRSPLHTAPARFLFLRLFSAQPQPFLDTHLVKLCSGLLAPAGRDGRKEFVMSKLRLEPRERTELLAYLEALLGCVKSLHASIGAVMADVAAIRNTVFEDAETSAYRRK